MLIRKGLTKVLLDKFKKKTTSLLTLIHHQENLLSERKPYATS